MKKMVFVCDRCKEQISGAGANIVPKFFDPGTGQEMGNTRVEMKDMHFCVDCTCIIMENVMNLCSADQDQTPEKETGKKKNVLDIGKVMALHNAGWSNKDIADEMSVSEKKIYNCIYHQKNKRSNTDIDEETEEDNEA